MSETRIPPRRYRARVVSIDRNKSTFYEIRYELMDPDQMTFLAGQYVMFHVADKVNRTLSIASTPGDTRHITICHDVKPGGVGSSWTKSLHIGDEVSFTGPLGKFTLRTDTDNRKIFIATGSGISPLRSMIDTLVPEAEGGSSALYWGLRHEDDIFWHDHFQSLAHTHDHFSYHLTLSKPTSSWKGHTGRVPALVYKTEETLTDREYYLCGNRNMVTDVREYLMRNGVDEAYIYNEVFF